MNEPIVFFAHGIPKGQPRPKAFSRGGHARVYDPGTAEGWKGAVAVGWKDRPLSCNPLPDAPLHLELLFAMPRPKGHLNSKGIIKESSPDWHTSTPDVDNMAKAVMDALTHLSAWRDDALVAKLTVEKRYGSPTGCLIRITPLT